VVRQDPTLGFDWGSDPPAPGLPDEGFSVRWRQSARFEQGLYDFHATMDDGMRVYVDGVLLIDEWRDEAAATDDAARVAMDLDAALATLAHDARLCIVLAYHEGMTHDEIASLTDIPVGTVKSHIRRGTLRLREQLAAYTGQSGATQDS
jgi:RNA polymerase sigma factor (sigma-70 family)